MKNKGFTLTELLVAIIVSMITLLAISSLFITSNRAVSVVKPASEAIEEVQTGLATLDFVMSRWGVGFPCNNNCVYDASQNCNADFANFNLSIGNNTTIDTITSAYGNNPLCMSILNNGSEVQFFASLGGSGFVKSSDSNGSQLVSCRLSTGNDNCYFLFNPTFSGFVQLSNLNSNNMDCIDLNITSNTNATVSNQLPIGGLLVRTPHFIRIYVGNDGWLKMDKKDIQNCNDSENAINIARVRSFKAERVNSRSVKFTIEFVSQTDSNKVFKVERIYSR